MTIEILLVAFFAAVMVGMNLKATILVWRDSLSEPVQRWMQIALVWLIPVVGALVVFAVHRPAERHPGKYTEPPDPGDDFGFPRHAGRRSGADGDDE